MWMYVFVHKDLVCYLPLLKYQSLSSNEYGFLFSLQSKHAEAHTCAWLYTCMQTPVPCSSGRECDYRVHFVCRHLLDRCICWANLDGFTVWILNQNHIFAPLTCGECRSRLPCLLPRPAIIHWQSRVGRKHRFRFLSWPHVELGWWMGTKCSRVYEHLIWDAPECVVLLHHFPNFSFDKTVPHPHCGVSRVVFAPSHRHVFLKVIFSSHLNHLSLITALLFTSLYSALLPEWQLSEVGSILIYFTWWWIFSVNSSFHAWLSNLMCAY